jgi:CP family cyanate transporter-like MFS transporter
VRLSSRILTLFAVGLVLRPQIVGVGPLLPRVEDSLHISHGVAGLLATIPVLCMGLFAPLAQPVLRRFGSRVAIGAALIATGVFGILRGVAPGAPGLLLLTVPVGVGIAVAGTLMPLVVREEHVERPALGTGVYTTGINVGATLAAFAAAPLAVAIGWRGALVVVSAVSIVLVVPWLVRRHAAVDAPERAPLPVRVPVAWLLVSVFALQSILFYGFNSWLPDAYTERGWSDTKAGALVAVMNAFSLVVGVTVALVADRRGSRRTYLATAAAVATCGSVLIAADVPGAFAWVALLGSSTGIVFTIAMTLPLDAAHSRAEVVAFTTLMLGVGYSVTALAPTALGALRDATGSFTLPLALLAGDAFVLFVVTVRMRDPRAAAVRTPLPPVA